MSDQPSTPGSQARVRARAAQRRAAPVETEDTELPEAWRKRPWIPLLIVGIVVALLLGSGLWIDQVLKAPVPAALAACKTSAQTGTHTFIARQPICISAAHRYTATINTTQGTIVIQLHPEIAPVTVNNFIVLATHGYYDQLKFWKVEPWVVQNGDPNGDGTGGPGYNLPDEPNPGGPAWTAGAVGMARVPGGPVNGSQFFIQWGAWPTPGPNAVYNRFGTVTSGLATVQLLSTLDVIKSITIAVS